MSLPRPWWPSASAPLLHRLIAWGAAAAVLVSVASMAVIWTVAPVQLQGRSESTVPPEDDCKPVVPPASTAAGSYFKDITDEAGIDFQHVVGPLGTYFMPESVGSGGALFDYDNDGLLDVYLVNAGRSPGAQGDLPPGTRTENRLYRQQPGGHFVEVTACSGLGDAGYGMGCAVADIDNDGHLDVYITNYGPDSLYRNNGDGTFTNITESAGIQSAGWGTGAVFFDYNRDGWPDLFVVNYTEDLQYGHSIACGFYQGRVSYCGPQKFQTTVDRLYRNDGVQTDDQGLSCVRFTDVTEAAGLTVRETWGFGVVAADFDRDGWPDVYVANDAGMSRMWMNGQDGTFREEGGIRGAAYNEQGTPEGSMGIALGDADGDGEFDLVVSNLSTEGASFFRRETGGLFAERSRESGIDRFTRPHTGWGTALIDLDHDGDLDLPLVNGRVVPCLHGFAPHGEEVFVKRNDRIDHPAAYWREYADANRLMFNRGDGRFEDRTLQGGDFTSVIASGRALAYGDIDEDGDLDLLVTNCGGKARLYRNDVPQAGAWLQIRLLDKLGARGAYGAEVIVEAGGRRFARLLNPAGSYLASSDPRLHYGLGEIADYEAILVRWPDGGEERFASGPVNQSLVLVRGQGTDCN